MTHAEIRKSALTLIERGKTDEALELLMGNKEVFSHKEAASFSLLSAQILQHKEERIMGLAKDDIDLNKAIAALIQLLNKSPQSSEVKKHNLKGIVLGVLGILLLGTVGGYYWTIDKKPVEKPCLESKHIIGYLKSDKERKPISGALVEILDAKGRTSITSLSGEFEFENIPPSDSLLLRISMEGREKLDTLKLDFCIEEPSIVLSALAFPDRMISESQRTVPVPTPNIPAERNKSCSQSYPTKSDRLGSAKARVLCCRNTGKQITCTIQLTKEASGSFKVCADNNWNSYALLESGKTLPASFVVFEGYEEKYCHEFEQMGNKQTHAFALVFSTAQTYKMIEKLNIGTTMGEFTFHQVQVD